MHYLHTEYAHKIRNNFIKSQDHIRNTTWRPRVSGVQMGEAKSKGLYTMYWYLALVTVRIYERGFNYLCLF